MKTVFFCIITFCLVVPVWSVDIRTDAVPSRVQKTIRSWSSQSEVSTGSYTIRKNSDNTFTVQTVYDSYETFAHLDGSLNLISSRIVFHEYETRDDDSVIEQSIERGDRKYIINTKEMNGDRKDKKVRIDDDALASEALDLFFISILADDPALGEEQELEIQWLPNPATNMSYRVSRSSGRQALSLNDEYEYPREFINFMNDQNNLYVVEAWMTGIAGSFYPHHFYYAYTTDRPSEPAAIWGGEAGEGDWFGCYE